MINNTCCWQWGVRQPVSDTYWPKNLHYKSVVEDDIHVVTKLMANNNVAFDTELFKVETEATKFIVTDMNPFRGSLKSDRYGFTPNEQKI